MALPLALALLPLVDGASDPVPAPEDVKAGWGAFFLFFMLIVAVVLLARSLVKQLRKAQAARDAGVYGDPPTAPDPASSAASEPAGGSNGHPAQP